MEQRPRHQEQQNWHGPTTTQTPYKQERLALVLPPAREAATGFRTNLGSTSDNVRNAVKFEFSTSISAFGIFGGDLETGAPGSPAGLLFISFTDGSTETIEYLPDSTLFPDATFSGTGNNTSETYGNETGRFIGIADDSRLIDEVIFVVGDDNQDDDGDSEQLSFIAPITFTDVNLDGT